MKKTLLTITLVMGLTACKETDSPVNFSVSSPDVNHVMFDARLKKKYGIGIGGEFDLGRIGSIRVIPESGANGFGLGFNLDAQAFVRDTFGSEYEEVSVLPTGVGFPEWMGKSAIDFVVPRFNSSDVNWHFYFGVRGEKTVGVAAQLKAIGTNIPSVNIGYVFYDKNGNVVLGVQFFGASERDGVLENGGILVGTNLSPLLPSGNVQALVSQAVDAARNAAEGGSVQIGGETVTTNVTVSGADVKVIKNERTFRRVMKQFIRATK